MAQRCGLKPEVEVMCGASDGCLAAYAGYISTGIRNSLTIGTSAAVRKVSETTVFDDQKQNFCYYLQDDLYVVGGTFKQWWLCPCLGKRDLIRRS